MFSWINTSVRTIDKPTLDVAKKCSVEEVDGSLSIRKANGFQLQNRRAADEDSRARPVSKQAIDIARMLMVQHTRGIRESEPESG